MEGEHQALALSMMHFFSYDVSARVLMIAGFHTGRSKVASFFETASSEGLDVDDICEMDTEGTSRPWNQRTGQREDYDERSRWVVVARLRRDKR